MSGIVYEAGLIKDGYTKLDKSPWLYESLPEKYYWMRGKYMYIIGPRRHEKTLIIGSEKQHAAQNERDNPSHAR